MTMLVGPSYVRDHSSKLTAQKYDSITLEYLLALCNMVVLVWNLNKEVKPEEGK